MPEENKGKNRAERVIEEAKQRFKQCVDAEADIRRKALDDLEFLAGNQWSQKSLAERAKDDRPALVVNRLDQFVLHVHNAMRQNRISARVFPVDDKADVDTAEVLQGVIRHIEYNSKGTLAYDTASFYATAMGFGYWLQITDYCDPLSFDQDVKLERIQNPFQVYLSPHTLPDGSDAEFGFVFTDMTREEFLAEYPKSEAAGMGEWGSIGDIPAEWMLEDTIRVVGYYCKEYKNDTLVRLKDGSTKLQSELDEIDGAEAFIAADADGNPVERKTRIPTVKWYKLNALEILDETTWPIPQIPIIKVTGHELTVNGKTILKGIVRNLKDAQRQYNFMLSAQTEAADSSKSQVIVAEGQEEGHEGEFRNLNKQQVVRYKPTDIKGTLVPPPNRLPPNMSIPAMTEARMMAADDLKALTGVYDAALGARSNETSGRGILARQQQTETANFHFQDNLLASITHSTKMLVDLIGKVYDAPRVVRVVGEDDSQKVVKINQLFVENQQYKKYDFTTGKYDVVCTAGPSFQTKRQEAGQRLIELASAAPNVMQAAPDLIVKSIDVPYSQEIAERLKKTLPPQLQEPKEGQPEIPPEVQQKLAQMSQMLELLTKELEAKTRLVETKQLELDSRERIEMAKIEAQRFELQLELDSKEAIALLQAEVEGIKAKMEVDSAQLAAETGAAARRM